MQRCGSTRFARPQSEIWCMHLLCGSVVIASVEDHFHPLVHTVLDLGHVPADRLNFEHGVWWHWRFERVARRNDEVRIVGFGKFRDSRLDLDAIERNGHAWRILWLLMVKHSHGDVTHLLKVLNMQNVRGREEVEIQIGVEDVLKWSNPWPGTICGC